MRIVELHAENIKRVKAVEVKPDPKAGLVVIAGRNRQGKTSVLDSIMYALGGEKAIPSKPIKVGEQSAKVRLVLDGADGTMLVVTRTFTTKGSYLCVESPEGAQLRKPQQILDSLLGRYTFDPLAFSRLPTKEQRATLLRLLDLEIDLDEHQSKRDALYMQRREINRRVSELQGERASMSKPGVNVPDDEVSIAQLIEQKEVADATNRENDQARRTALETYRQVTSAEESLRRAEDALRMAKLGLEKASEIWKTAKAKAERCQDVDTSTLRQQIALAEEVNRSVRLKKQHISVSQRIEQAETASEKLTRQMACLEQEKISVLEGAEMPIKGLGIEAETVCYNGIPFEQISASEQLSASVAIGMALNPKLRVLRITDGSLLDEEGMAALQQIAVANDYDIWIERVLVDGASVIIEDGMVIEPNQVASK